MTVAGHSRSHGRAQSSGAPEHQPGAPLRDSPRIARRAARKEELLDAAVTAIHRSGLSTSMDQIAAEAGVTKPILYRHFGDRAGLIRALEQRYERDLTAHLTRELGITEPTDGPAEAYRLLFDTVSTYVRFVEEHLEMYRFLTRYPQGDTRQDVSNLTRRIARHVAIAIDIELNAIGLDTGPAELWAHGIVGMVHAAGDWWVDHPVLSRQRMVDSLASLLWFGFEGIAINAGIRAHGRPLTNAPSFAAGAPSSSRMRPRATPPGAAQVAGAGARAARATEPAAGESRAEEPPAVEPRDGN